MLHLICALKCEAKPLIQHFRLSYNNEATLFPVYLNKDKTVSLTISGTGKIAASAAVMYAYMLLDTSRTDIWVNTGIGGHRSLTRGQAVLANKIMDQASGRSWYPQILFQTTIPATTVMTVDTPATNYNDEVLLDMEAAGFYETVSRFGLAELCHSLKIVSDNEASHHGLINASYVSQSIAGNLDHMDVLVAALFGLANGLIQPTAGLDKDYEIIISRWHFSQTQRTRLKRLLKRWYLLCPEVPVIADEDAKYWQNSRAILEALNARLDRVPFQFGDNPNR
ncbi:MAG: hypothetical protein WD709_03790 [Gammaproteobacteria bacterium]